MSTAAVHSRGRRAQAWLKPRQVRELRTVAWSDTILSHLRDRNEAIIATLSDTGLRVGEPVQLEAPE